MLFRLFTRWQVKGKDNVPSQGALLVVANHINLLDIPLLGICFERRLIFLAKKELFRSRWFGFLISKLGAFPVHRGQGDIAAFRQAERILAGGQTLVMFPEGTRSRSGQLQSGFPGSALVALHSDAAILPVAITGTERCRGAGWLLRRPRLVVNIGNPFRLPPVAGKVTKTELAELTNLIMEHIAELLPVEYQGNYQAGKTK